MECAKPNNTANAPEQMYVKWENPTAELVGVAKLLLAFEKRDINNGNELAVAVPNMTWAVQMQRACKAAGVLSSVRAHMSHLSAATKKQLTLARALAHPSNSDASSAWAAFGGSEEELQALQQKYASAKAAAIIRVAKLNACPELQHALLHICGDESAQQLYSTLEQQLNCPSDPEGLQVVAIVPYTHIAKTYSQLFFVGCVKGLLPENGESAQAFLEIAKHAKVRMYYSGFAKADESVAKACKIAYVRTKREGEGVQAICSPTGLFTCFGHTRPSTLGGQVLLRQYGLN